MGVELEVDMGYLGDDELAHVVLHDECGEHESVEYVRRDEYDEMREATARRKDMCLRLQDENARLRGLVAELWALAYGYVPVESELDAARDMMRELGMEVDA